MTEQALLPAQANLKIALWQADADEFSSNELYVWLSETKLPNEVTIRLHQLLGYTKKIASQVYSIGKIIIIKIIEFVKAHPSLVMGAGIGATIGYAVTTLMISVPFFGQLLAPLATALGIGITVVGAVAGHRLDKRN